MKYIIGLFCSYFIFITGAVFAGSGFCVKGTIFADSSFVKAKGYVRMSETPRQAIFSSRDGDLKLPYIEVADPAYDQTFKRLFTWTEEIGGYTGKDRLMSLLNSILYPTAGENGYKIREIEPLPNERNRLGEQSNLGVLRFDIACRCHCWSNNGNTREEKIIDIEMQTCYEGNFVGRLFDYGSSLRAANQRIPVKVFAFLNYKKGNSQGIWIGLFYRDLVDGHPTELVDDNVDTYGLNLPQELEHLLAGENVKVEGQDIGSSGREWLKLLSIRHWGYALGNRFMVPDTVADPVVRSALLVLSSINEPDLQRYINEARSWKGMLQGAIQEGEAKGKAEGLAEGRLEAIIKYYFSQFKKEYNKKDGKVSIKLGQRLKDIDVNTVKEILEKNRSIDKKMMTQFIAYIEACKKIEEGIYEKEPSFLDE